MGGRGPLQRRSGSGSAELRDRSPTAQRHRRPAHGTCAAAVPRRRAGPDASHAGLQRALPARVRPRRHLDPERGREAPRHGRKDPSGPRPRGLRGARVGVAPRVRRQDHVPVPAHRRVAGLPARALHDGRRVRPSRDAVLRPPVPQGVDLPRQSDHQLVPFPPDVALGPRARARGRRRRSHLRSLSARRR